MGGTRGRAGALFFTSNQLASTWSQRIWEGTPEEIFRGAGGGTQSLSLLPLLPGPPSGHAPPLLGLLFLLLGGESKPCSVADPPVAPASRICTKGAR